MERFMPLFALMSLIGFGTCALLAASAVNGKRPDLSGFYATFAVLAALFGLWMGAAVIAILMSPHQIGGF